MLNKVWFGLLLVGVLYGFGRALRNELRGLPAPNGEAAASSDASGGGVVAKELPLDEAKRISAERRGLVEMGRDLNAAVLDAATSTIELCVGMIGIMALWLGLLNIAKDAGLVDALARLLRPVMRLLFPDVPDGHPAQGAMLMNLSANMLGLDNAATPLGLKAMRELQTLNTEEDTATNSMAMFLALNTSNVTLIPFAIIGYRVLNGSQDPAQPMLGILLTTTVATCAAIVAVQVLVRMPRFAQRSGNSSSDAPPVDTAPGGDGNGDEPMRGDDIDST